MKAEVGNPQRRLAFASWEDGWILVDRCHHHWFKAA